MAKVGMIKVSSSSTPFALNLTLLMMMGLLFMSMSMTCHANLSSTFYDKACPKALTTIRSVIRAAVAKERRMAASLVRLHFHDCFVEGCDASILLNDDPTERIAPPNLNSVRGYEVIDDAKAKVEKICPGVVSCADIVAVAARDSTVAVGGPSWTVKLGRRDSTAAYPYIASTDLPSFSADLNTLISGFQKKGLNARDMVALSGAHTIGQARCLTFRERIYNGTASGIDARFASKLQLECPETNGVRDDSLAALDVKTPNYFDNDYFKNLMRKKGLLESDQVLYSGGSTDGIVYEYSKYPSRFLSDFAAAMVKMGDISPLTGSNGQIRKICSVVN